MTIQLGLCCINDTLSKQKPKVFMSRSITRRKVDELGIDEVKRRALANLDDIPTMMEWNEDHGIKVFRLSSDIFPRYTDPQIPCYTMEFARDKLLYIGDLARQLNHRLTMHPSQFNVLGSDDDTKLDNTFDELIKHADIFNYMKMDQNSVIVLHVGGVYRNKNQSLNDAKRNTIYRWCHNFKELPQDVGQRLVVENCEKSYTVEDCLTISDQLNIPVVLDTHHYSCYSLIHPDIQQRKMDDLIPDIIKTWTRRDIKPKFHISGQGEGRIGHHSDYVRAIPKELLSIKDKYGIDIDIMVEAKAKEKAVLRLCEKYNL